MSRHSALPASPCQVSLAELIDMRHQLREVQRELTAANLRVDDTDFSKLGAHTANLLKVAEAQSADMIEKAQNRAQSLLETAQAEAERTRNDAASTAVVVARFLSLLELFREGAVAFEQAEALGELQVRWTGGEADYDGGEDFDEVEET